MYSKHNELMLKISDSLTRLQDSEDNDMLQAVIDQVDMHSESQLEELLQLLNGIEVNLGG